MPPTSAPTEAPTPSTPTAAPTFSDKSVYVRQNGCDYGYCNSSNNNLTYLCTNSSNNIYSSTCKTIEYSWNCYLGIEGYPDINGCKQKGYDGNGVFDIGDGIWNFPYQINFGDNNVIIRGQGPESTTFNYIGDESKWITCRWHKCWIGLQDLTISSNKTNPDNIQFYMNNGGTLHIKNVVFDGNKYAVNQNNDAFWQFINQRVNVEFIDCYFTNNDIAALFSNGVTASFDNCTFEGNHITSEYEGDYNSMFIINGSNVIFNHCIFINNTQSNRGVFSVYNKGYLSIFDSIFMDNVDLAHNSSFVNIWQSESSVNMEETIFVNNIGYKNIINVLQDGQLLINSTLFADNHVSNIIRYNNAKESVCYNCTFYHNSIDEIVSVNKSDVLIEESTLDDNQQHTQTMFVIQNYGNVILRNCVLRRNTIDNQTENGQLVNVYDDGALELVEAIFKMNNGYQSIIQSKVSAKIVISASIFEENNVTSIISANHNDLWNNNKFDCISNENADISIASSIFTANNVHYLIYNYGGNIYIDDNNIITNNECNNYYIQSFGGSISINGDYLYSINNYIDFGHGNSINNISLCIRDKYNIASSSYISTDSLTKINGKLIYGECLETYTESNYSATFEDYGLSSPKIETRVFNVSDDGNGQNISCSLSDATLCKINCDAANSCDDAIITIDMLHTDILCQKDKSCEQAEIITNISTDRNINSSLHIICDEGGSCDSVKITVRNINKFKLDCLSGDSCIYVTINLSNTILSEINCYSGRSCDHLKVHTDNDYTLVTIHEWSEDVAIFNTFGYRNYNLKCGSNNGYIMVDNNQYEQGIYDPMPCNGVKYICNGTHSCNVYQNHRITDLNSDGLNICYGPTYLNDIHVFCNGTCPLSEAPTNAPTTSPTLPTESPSAAPSYSPSLAPSNNPSIAPSLAPSQYPTVNPSIAPSSAPTTPPSNSPSSPPTNAPSNTPSQPPSNVPSAAPTIAPSSAPTSTSDTCFFYFFLFLNTSNTILNA